MNRTAAMFATVATLAVGGLGASAQGANLLMTFTGLGPSKAIKVNYNAGRSFNQNASSYSSYNAGRMKWNDNYGRNLVTYCVQITETISNNQTVNYAITSVANVPDPTPGPMGAIKATLIKDLYARYYFSTKNSTNANQNAAFQLAVWEITHENLAAANAAGALAQLNVYAGALAVNKNHAETKTVGDLAMSFLASLGTSGFKDIGGGLMGLTHPDRQDQLLVVPLPVPAALAGLGLLGGLILRRRGAK